MSTTTTEDPSDLLERTNLAEYLRCASLDTFLPTFPHALTLLFTSEQSSKGYRR